MSYTITITETRKSVEKAGKEWARIIGDGASAQWGYTPEIEKAVTRDVKVFEQTVDTLNLAAVIKAINGL